MATMDAKTREALEASIAHHKQNLLAETPSDVGLSVEECALCGLFYDNGCIGCPVLIRTGRTECFSTPYGAAWRAFEVWEMYGTDAARGHFRDAERRMITFLESLRPDDGANERAE